MLRLPALAVEQTQRIAALPDRYQVKFELRMNAATSTNDGDYLEILDRAWFGGRLPRQEFTAIWRRAGTSSSSIMGRRRPRGPSVGASQRDSASNRGWTNPAC
jgi:hypothetical protein